MANRTKPVQVKFSLSEEQSKLFEEYLKSAGKTKQEVFEAFVNMLIKK